MFWIVDDNGCIKEEFEIVVVGLELLYVVERCFDVGRMEFWSVVGVEEVFWNVEIIDMEEVCNVVVGIVEFFLMFVWNGDVEIDIFDNFKFVVWVKELFSNGMDGFKIMEEKDILLVVVVGDIIIIVDEICLFDILNELFVKIKEEEVFKIDDVESDDKVLIIIGEVIIVIEDLEIVDWMISGELNIVDNVIELCDDMVGIEMLMLKRDEVDVLVDCFFWFEREDLFILNDVW